MTSPHNEHGQHGVKRVWETFQWSFFLVLAISALAKTYTPLTNILPFHWFRARHIIQYVLVLLDDGRVIVHRFAVR